MGYERIFGLATTAQDNGVPIEEFRDQQRALTGQKSVPSKNIIASFEANGISIPGISSEERREREALSQEARDFIVDYASSYAYAETPDVSPKTFRRHHFGVENMARHLHQDYGQTIGQIVNGTDLDQTFFYRRLLNQVRANLEHMQDSLENMSDEDLVRNKENIFLYHDFVQNIAGVLDEAEERKDPALDSIRKNVEFISSFQGTFSTLVLRMDLIANPYYADIPYSTLVQSDPELISEIQQGFDSKSMPDDYLNQASTLRTFQGVAKRELLGRALDKAGYPVISDAPKKDFLSQRGIQPLDASGNPQQELFAMQLMSQHKPLLLKVPQANGEYRLLTVQPPALSYSMDVVLAPAEDLFNRGAISAIQDLNSQVIAADRRVLSGSVEFASMKRNLELLEENFRTLSGGDFTPQNFLKCQDLLAELAQSSQEYLDFKQAQRGSLEGKNAREQARIDAAQQVSLFASQKLRQLDFLNGSQEFRQALEQNSPLEPSESTLLADKAMADLPKGQAQGMMEKLSQATQRDVRALSELASLSGDTTLSAAQQQDARIRMARLVVNDVIQLQGPNSAMKMLYAEGPARFLQNYANSKDFKAALGKLEPDSIKSFLENNTAHTMAESIVAGLSVKEPQPQNPQPPQNQIPPVSM